jgi:hypothetical protein
MGGGRGDGGGVTSLLEFRVQMSTICVQNSQNNTLSRLFRGVGCWAGCVFSSRYLFENYSVSSRYELESEKKARRGQGLGLDPRLVPSYPRSSNSLG